MHPSCKNRTPEEFLLLLLVELIKPWTPLKGKLATGCVSEAEREEGARVVSTFISLEPLKQISYRPVTVEDDCQAWPIGRPLDLRSGMMADLLTFVSPPCLSSGCLQRFLNCSVILLREPPHFTKCLLDHLPYRTDLFTPLWLIV